MKNVKINKRLLLLLLAGSITVTSIACSVKKSSNASTAEPAVIEYAQQVQDAPIAGEVTLTEHALDLPEDVTLVNNEALVVSEPISEVMRYYQEFNLGEVHAKAVTLNSSVVRTGPGTNYEKVDVLYRGAIVEVLGRADNGWYLIDFNGSKFFTIGSNISIINYLYDGLTLKDIVPNLTRAIQPTTELNVRSQPRKDSYQLGLISGKRTYKVLELLDNGWYKIDYQGQEAYVCGKYCRETYILDGRFYQYVYPKHDCYLYDENGNIKRDLEKGEGGPVYDENDEYYLIWVGDDYGFVKRSDVKIAPGKVIETDESLQQTTVYNGSELVLQIDTCTGKDSTPTDRGIYTLGSETGPTTLRGPGYEVDVDNFASVNGGEGYHPMGKTKYGDVNYYHQHGSHGCYRLPPDRYKEFFEATQAGDMVIMHR